ncbi:WecB/TagA/CpsF family glycosyltransferase [Butyrivibrio sp. MC2013]|uniref:WecB/TagA/CpsF family glycosyltransferase n=1 Tax=Butyrivibrio sp. MC2013 TaxID=1280686 RepID=UPI000421DF78|nr:WecB/TagA/CpsF family glycosyltransferase [Butyrivibrio sp. MC2013]
MNRKNYPVRRVFVIDEFSIIIAMCLAITIRYDGDLIQFHILHSGLYMYILLTLCIFHVIVFYIYDLRKPSIFEQDPFENLITVAKSRFILLAMCMLYLYVAQRGVQTSRVVVGLLFVFSVIIDYALRIIYRHHHIRRFGLGVKRHVLKVSYPYPDEESLRKTIIEGSYDDLLILQDGASQDELTAVMKAADRIGIRAYCSLMAGYYTARSGIVTDIKSYASIPISVRKDKFHLFGIEYSIGRTEEAVLHVIRHAKELSGKYVCFSNVHTSVMARENPEYAHVLNGSAFTFPDGNPIAVLQRKRGLSGADRIAGPDFMEHMFRNTQDGKLSHYFYGSKQETLDRLKENLEKRYPGIVIKGMYSPPFRKLSEEEDKEHVEMINAAGADIVWIGLGAPKQEKWMKDHEDKIDGIMMGVGAGFDFHAGTIKRAPDWIQKIGFEWLYRLFQDPSRLIKRYFITNIKFFWYIAMESLKKGC